MSKATRQLITMYKSLFVSDTVTVHLECPIYTVHGKRSVFSELDL
jgi:hypothetical protein